jgi:hypothetical protein
LVAAAIGALLLVYEPLQAVTPWHQGPRWLHYSRMVPFFVLVVVLGALVTRRHRIAWAIAIAVARVAFHDVAARTGIYGPRDQWVEILALPSIGQGIVIIVALLMHTAAYWALMSLGGGKVTAHPGTAARSSADGVA